MTSPITPSTSTYSPVTETSTRRSRGTVIAAAAFAGLGLAGAATAITLFIATPASAHASKTTHAAAVITPVVHHTDVVPVHPVTPATPVTPAYNASIATVQRELGQLNYYEGPINGIMTPQTQQAITYLQRSANLPQTGQLDTATVNALMNQLANGNSQMGN